MKYYKISPEWAERLKATRYGVEHPDGWYLVLPNFITGLRQQLYPDEIPMNVDLDRCVEEIGGCIYDDAQAKASERGDEEFMMDGRNDIPEGAVADVPSDVATELAAEAVTASESVITTGRKIRKGE